MGKFWKEMSPEIKGRIREDYTTIKSAPTSSELYMISKVQEAIRSSGGDYSVLDETHKRTSQEMEQEFQAETKKAYLRWARRHYDQLKVADTAVFREHESMKTCLTLSGKDLTALDPTGKKSYAEAQYEYENTLKEAYIREGRTLMRVLKGKNPATAEEAGATLKDLIDNKKLKAADLDPQGQRSDADMIGAINFALQIAETRRAGTSGWWIGR